MFWNHVVAGDGRVFDGMNSERDEHTKMKLEHQLMNIGCLKA